MLNERSDVYSFGVLIMEIITGRSPVDYTRPAGEVSVVAFLITFFIQSIKWSSKAEVYHVCAGELG
jgi:serine/threonine protein kinase